MSIIFIDMCAGELHQTDYVPKQQQLNNVRPIFRSTRTLGWMMGMPTPLRSLCLDGDCCGGGGVSGAFAN